MKWREIRDCHEAKGLVAELIRDEWREEGANWGLDDAACIDDNTITIHLERILKEKPRKERLGIFQHVADFDWIVKVWG